MLNAGELASRLKGIESLLALALSRSAGGAGSGTISSFLWQPGGVAGENTFTTWAALAPVLAATKGEKTVAVDTTIAAAHITAGAWGGITDVTMVAAGAVPVETIVNIDDGATFTSTHRLVFDGIVVEWAGTTVPLISQGGAGFVYIGFQNLSGVAQTGGQPFVALSGTATLVGVAVNECTWGPGTIRLSAGTTGDLVLFNASTLSSGAVIGGAGTLGVVYDLSSLGLISASQSPAPILDYQGAANVVQATGNTGTGSNTLTVTTPTTVIQVMTGRMLVEGSALIATSAGATITAQLVRDAGTGGAANIGQPKTITTAAAVPALDLALSFVDTAPDAAAHSYQFKVTVSAGNVTCAANSAQIVVTEQP